MASILLSEVPDPAGLRDLISREWAEYREFRNNEPPVDLRATSWHDAGNTSPSHSRGAAIDLVTPDWSQRGYLFEFGLWLAVRYQAENLNVIFYKRTPQPHLHVALWSGRVGKPEASIGFSKDGAHDYEYVMPPYNVSSTYILSLVIDWMKTYTDNKVDFDKAYWRKAIAGEEKLPWERSGWFGKILPLLKKYWWAFLLPVVIAVPLVIWYRSRSDD